MIDGDFCVFLRNYEAFDLSLDVNLNLGPEEQSGAAAAALAAPQPMAELGCLVCVAEVCAGG